MSPLVPSGSTIRSTAEVDRAGMRVVVIGNPIAASSASQSLKNAGLILVRTAVERYELLQAG